MVSFKYLLTSNTKQNNSLNGIKSRITTLWFHSMNTPVIKPVDNEPSFIVVTSEGHFWSCSLFDERVRHTSLFSIDLMKEWDTHCWFHEHGNSQPKFCDFSLLVSVTFYPNVNSVYLHFTNLYYKLYCCMAVIVSLIHGRNEL